VDTGVCTFLVEVRRADGSLVGVSDASVSCCVDDAWLRDVQAGQLANDGELPALRVAPSWHDTQRPVVTGLSLSLGDRPPRHYPREVFFTEAHGLIQRLRKEELIATTEKVSWNVVARDSDPEAPRHRVRTKRAPFPLEPASLPHVAAGDYEICIHAGILRRLGNRIVETRSVEGAELLVGHLLHDAERHALELRVVDALPLEPGRDGSSNSHFSFDPAATAAVRRSALTREDGAQTCGWHHNHNPCEGCWEHPDCQVDWVFFSGDDCQVHATLFASPHMVALVGGKAGALPATRPGFRLYGWREGRVVERPFQVVGDGSGEWDSEQRTFRDEPVTHEESPMIETTEEASK
jgi:hypothetical protein